MRKVLDLMREVYTISLQEKAQKLAEAGTPVPPEALNKRIRGVQERFAFIDSRLSQLRVNSLGGFDEPETRLGEVMTTGDFPYALGEFVQRRMLPSYTQRRFEFEPLVKPDTLPNFLAVTRYQNRAGVDDLEYVGEKGSARPGYVSDAVKRQYQVYVWEKQYDFSFQALINDDLGYFNDTAEKMGRAARRTLEKFVSRMMTNAVTVARLVALGALYSTTGRLNTTRISTARMAFGQRVDARNENILADLRYIVYHSGLEDVVRTIQRSTLVPENATNAENVVRDQFVPIKNPYIVGVAPNLPWYAFTGWQEDNIIPFVLARMQGVPAPRLIRKKSNIEQVTGLLGGGSDMAPVWGDYATGNLEIKVQDIWGTYINGTDGNMFDHRGCYYSAGTAA